MNQEVQNYSAAVKALLMPAWINNADAFLQLGIAERSASNGDREHPGVVALSHPGTRWRDGADGAGGHRANETHHHYHR